MSNDHSGQPAALEAGKSADHGQPVVIGSGGWFGDLRGPAGCAVNFRARAKSWRTVADNYAPDEATRERARVRAEIYDDCAHDIERSLGPLPNTEGSRAP